VTVIPVVLVEGNDPTLVGEAVEKAIRELLGGEDRSLALEDYEGDDVDLAAVADSCLTPPLLVSRRVIVVRSAGRYSTEDVDPLLRYLGDPLPTTALVLGGGGGQIAPKLVAAAKAKGTVISTTVDARQAGDWLAERLGQASVRLDREAQNLVRAHLGEDVSAVVPLLELLEAAYGPGAKVGPGQVEVYLGEQGSVTPWALSDAIDAGDAALALGMLHRMLGAGGRHPLVVISILHRHVAGLMRVDSPAISSEVEAAAAMGIAPGRSTFPAKKALRSAHQWGSANIAEAIGLVADADADLKGASSWAGEAVLEVLVARLCRLARAKPAATHGHRVTPRR
jgi:DNA polymerase-3 subunit delta